MRDAFWLQGMQAGHRMVPECTAAFSATDFRPDLDKFDVPTHVIHGDEDQVVPFEVGGKASAARIRGAERTVYRGAPHGIAETHKGSARIAPFPDPHFDRRTPLAPTRPLPTRLC